MLTILSHELNTAHSPYSAGVSKRVNKGVVNVLIPFCNTLHTKNHTAAFACTGSE
ncbi:hypothetical protein [Bacteroides thetaiotaomicron]|uniref:hypothetical protein n=1 Tax=Bacteroides thetaiotaomicron TaxID=818 RepID=UPI0039C1441C